MYKLKNSKSDFDDLRLIHRLDRDTSGLILFAKNIEAQREFTKLFETHDILKKYNLRHTDTRENILDGFIQQNAALSHGDLENLLIEGFDRVTIYRTLKTFVEKGILHKIPDETGGVKYAMCKDQCQTDHHNHDHVHFKCSKCGDTTCIDQYVDYRCCNSLFK